MAMGFFSLALFLFLSVDSDSGYTSASAAAASGKEGVEITYGSAMKLMHEKTKFRLHSHDVPYGSGSGQQSVTAFPGVVDSNSYWIVKPVPGTTAKQGDAVMSGATIRLQHMKTRKWLHSHLHASPISGNLEVSCFGDDSNSDTGDHWKLIIEGSGKTWKQDQRVRLQHIDTSGYLHSHDKKYQRIAGGQQEVCGIREKRADNVWLAAEGVYLPVNESSSNIHDGEENSTKLKNDLGGDDSVWLVSSDSEPPSSDPISQKVIILTEEDEDLVILDKEVEPAVKKAPKKKSPKKKPNSGRQIPKEENSAQEISEDKDTDSIVADEVTTDKNTKPSSGSSSKLPLVLSEKVNRTKVLVECEGDSIDLSGDMGAVGRVVVSDTTQDVFLDLKGTIYKSTIVQSRTFCVVNVSQSEAKIEAIMNDFIQLTPVSNVYEAETMVEGTLEGFSFESDDEGNKNAKTASKPPDDQSRDTAEVTKGSGKAKAKSENVVGKKRGRPSKEKQQQPAKKARSSSAPKKTKPKK